MNKRHSSLCILTVAVLYMWLAPGVRAQAPPAKTLPAEPLIQPPVDGLHLPALIGDHMVLQQGARTPLWGWANPGERVSVTAGGTGGSATADGQGKWRIELPGLKSTGEPIEVKVSTPSKTVVVHDVLVGDVWYCSGQSNMEIPLSYVSSSEELIARANRPTLRLFVVFNRPALDPQDDCRGEWKVSTPESARSFSALGYLFGSEISDTERVPVGMIGGYSGGSWISSWIGLESLLAHPESKAKYGDPFLSAKTLVPKTMRTAAGLPPDQAQAAAWADLITSQWIHDDWYDHRGGAAYAEAMEKWHAEADPIFAKNKAAGLPPPPAEALPPRPLPPVDKEPRAGDGRTLPTMLFNGLLHPIIPSAIKGIIWYQGESDRGIGTDYRVFFPQMIADWRAHWGEGDFPFVFVQLAGYTASDDTTNNNWSLIQEAQRMTLTASPHTAMVVANDIGDLKNIHPRDKVDLGHRLALAARHAAYGEDIVFSGPIYDSFEIDGNKLRLKFKETGGGLKIGLPPPEQLKLFPQPLPVTLDGFVVCGSDGRFVPATAAIDGPDTVVVSSEQVVVPVAARYAWGNTYGNLYNQEGLPASPFRTDPGTPALPVKPPPKPPAASAPSAK